jgi:hypothetical protein
MMRGRKRRAAALHGLKLTHAVKGIARRPCPLLREVRFGNRPIPIRQRCMRQPRAIDMVLCGVFSVARPGLNSTPSNLGRSATTKIGTFSIGNTIPLLR